MILEIHEITKSFFNKNMNECVLTFDDAHFSQYYYWNEIKKLGLKRIIFVTSDMIDTKYIVRSQFKNSYNEFPDRFKSMQNYKLHKIKSNYMSLHELKDIIKTDTDVIIGGHGHRHFGKNDYLDNISGAKLFEKDLNNMLEWFDMNLNFIPTHYCFPHSYEPFLSRTILKKYNFAHIYGSPERVNIDGI